MKIAVDAMGGDYAPEAIVEGAILAAEEYGHSLVLVGQEDRVHQELVKYQTDHLAIEVRHAPQIVEMHDLPSVALRRKRDSSLHVAINMIKHGEADAAVSAGNTGAAMAIGKVACRVLEGVDRPALATVFPNIDGVTVVIDVGANVDCKPVHLLQFAVMGHAYAQEVFHINNPRIGLLSIGEESSKGNELTKEVFEPLNQSCLNFIGNAEGRDVFNGRVDVIVCDGFTGNVVLKVSESLAKTLMSILKDVFTHNWRSKLGYLLVKSGLSVMRKRIDYSEYGGAPLLGLNGVVIVSHGSSKANAIKNAIRVAAESVDHHINDQIVEMMLQCEFDTKSRSRATSLWRHITRSIRHDPLKDKADAEFEHRDNAALTDLGQEEEQAPQEDEKPAELQQDELSDIEKERRHWWNLKQRGEQKQEEQASPEEPVLTEVEAQPATEPLSEEPLTPLKALKAPQEDEISHEPISQKIPTASKRVWWKRREGSPKEYTPEEHSEREQSEAESQEEANPPISSQKK